MPRWLRLGLGLVFLLAGAGAFGYYFMQAPAKGELDIKVHHKPTVMTCAYKAYGNAECAGGKYWLGKVVLRNQGGSPIKNVRVSFHIPDYVEWTTPETYPEVLPGQTVVLPYYPRLPARVAETQSLVNSTLETKVEYNDGAETHSKVIKRDFQLRGVTEFEYSSLKSAEIIDFYDRHDNQELLSAWVTEEDPAVKAFIAKVSEKYGGLGTMGNRQEVEQFARSVYDFMVRSGMTYSGTKGTPEKRGDEYVMTQSIRLPRDLIYNNTGLCIELAGLWASLATATGANCYLVLIPGHCFPVLEAGDGSLLPIEATGIGGSSPGGNLGGAASFDDAVKSAAESLQGVLNGTTPGYLHSVRAMRREGIRPPELKDIDRPALSKLLDDRVRVAAPSPAPQPVVQQTIVVNPPQPQGGALNPLPPGFGEAGWVDPARRVSLNYPSQWATDEANFQVLRQLIPAATFSVEDPDLECGVDVFIFDGLGDLNAPPNQLVNLLRQIGMTATLSPAQGVAVDGYQGQMFTLDAYDASNDERYRSVLVASPYRGGVVMVGIGGPLENIPQAQAALSRVLDTVRLAH